MFKYLVVFIFVINLFSVSYGQDKKYTIVLDAGHGGKDPGNLSSGENFVHEKEINLKIVKKIQSLLSDNFDNLTIVTTRDSDVFVSLENRTFIANSVNADFFISIHANSNPKTDIFGSRIHIYDNSNKKSLSLAKCIDSELADRKETKSLGIMDTRENGMNLYVLKNTSMVALLIETGFMSNPAEEEYLNSEKGQNQIARCVFQGINSYLNSDVTKVTKPTKRTNKTTTNTEKNTKSTSDYVFRVQIKASVSQIPMTKFKKLEYEVYEIITENDTFKYKYQVGNEKTMKDANNLRKKLLAKGYKDAFVVKVKI